MVLAVSSHNFYTHPCVEYNGIRDFTRSSRFEHPVWLLYQIEMLPVSEAVQEVLCLVYSWHIGKGGGEKWPLLAGFWAEHWLVSKVNKCKHNFIHIWTTFVTYVKQMLMQPWCVLCKHRKIRFLPNKTEFNRWFYLFIIW